MVRLLDANEEEVLVGRHQYFLAPGAHSEESHVIHGVDVADDWARLHRQVRDVVGDRLRGRRGRRLVSLRDNAPLIIDDQQCAHTLVIAYPINALFKVSHALLISNLLLINIYQSFADLTANFSN